MTPDRTNRAITSDSEQSVLNKSQDAKYDVLVVELLAENAAGTDLVRLKTNDSGGLNISQGPVTKRFDTSSSTILYTATAPVGTADSSLGWTITKFDLTNSSDSSGKVATDVSWANKSAGSYN